LKLDSRFCPAAIDSEGRTIWIVDPHRDHGKRLVVLADEMLAAFMGLESTICASNKIGVASRRDFSKIKRSYVNNENYTCRSAYSYPGCFVVAVAAACVAQQLRLIHRTARRRHR
jgi:hypothetical protein